MLKILSSIIIFTLVSISTSLAINPLESIPADKVLHAEFGYITSDLLQDGLKWDATQTFFGEIALGYAKEELDVACGGKFDITDIYAQMVGWAIRRALIVKIIF